MAYIPIYILILFFTIIIDYYAGILIEDAPEEKKRRYLIMSIITNVGILAFFKYYNFFVDNVNTISGFASSGFSIPALKIILPIGLSFHTFQAMSYTIEVYRENQKAERHFGIYALYVMFYPQLVAGPIERPQNILHQFHEKKYVVYDNVAKGIRLMLWGLIKKVVVADRLVLVTDPIFNDPTKYSGIALAIATVFFAFQVYCDFSGYSDIALGCAKVMGFDLMLNFNRPFSSKSLSELWRRWHISLSTWFTDYLFNPLAYTMRRYKKWGIVISMLITFFLSGLWHGASWNFILWGVVYGIGLVYEIFTKDARTKIFSTMPKWLANTLGMFFTFSFVALASIFFRCNTVKDSFYIFRKLTHIPSEFIRVATKHETSFLNLPNIYRFLLPCLGVIVFLEAAQYVADKYHFKDTFNNKPAMFRWTIYYSGLAALLFLGVYEKHPFVYFQF